MVMTPSGPQYDQTPKKSSDWDILYQIVMVAVMMRNICRC